MPDPGTGASPRPAPEEGACSVVARRLDELLAGDLPVAMHREIEPHLSSCVRCRNELATSAALIAELRALPIEASLARSWERIAVAIELERREQPLPWLTQVAALVAAGIAIASTLVRHSPEFADRLAAPSSWQPWLLPALFVLFGAMTAVAAMPLLLARGRAALARVR